MLFFRVHRGWIVLWGIFFIAACGSQSADTQSGVGTQGSSPTEGQEDPSSEPPKRVLFIGNSFTYWNDGLDIHLKAMRQSEAGESDFDADKVVRGGASLEVMWSASDAQTRIRSGDYDVVILQEDIPETTVESFFIYARKFDELIRESGATPLLYMAWDYERLDWISMTEIADAHKTIAEELSIPVAPVGLAWKRAGAQRPEMNMYDDDNEHPSIYGTYLATTTIYSVLFDADPRGLLYRPSQNREISDEEATFLQAVAWEEVQAN